MIPALGNVTEHLPGSPGLYWAVNFILHIFLYRHSLALSSGSVQISLECTGPQQYNGTNPVFICSTIPEI